jgi:hypothetical protein
MADPNSDRQSTMTHNGDKHGRDVSRRAEIKVSTDVIAIWRDPTVTQFAKPGDFTFFLGTYINLLF